MSVRPKKHLGQHFLTSELIAGRIVDALHDAENILEIGPGTGVLTGFLKERTGKLVLVELDSESVAYLNNHYPDIQVIEDDFLKLDPDALFDDTFAIIGNFPYNISSQIFFRVLDYRNRVEQVVCMLQKEVAQRIAEPPGSKVYGILSVLLQAYFEIEYLFTVKPGAFHPPPKVDSAVIRLVRNTRRQLDCNEKLFFRVVKQGFQNRRKTLRNALKPINLPVVMNSDPLLDRRAETLSVDEFVSLTNKIEQGWNR